MPDMKSTFKTKKTIELSEDEAQALVDSSQAGESYWIEILRGKYGDKPLSMPKIERLSGCRDEAIKRIRTAFSIADKSGNDYDGLGKGWDIPKKES